MIRHTFQHIAGIGQVTERRLWDLGVRDWDQVVRTLPPALPTRLRGRLPDAIGDSDQALRRGDARFFAERLAAKHVWRLYPAFRDKAAFLDIETTGLSFTRDRITTIAVYDGKRIRTYVRGQNLEEFPEQISRHGLLVTYNGRCFDAPFIQHQFPGLGLDQAHIDLRYFLGSLGYRGGLKGCERQMGLARAPGLQEVDGFMAVKLWRAHERGDRRALPALLRYNVEDVVNLRWLLETGYNMAVARLPIEVERLCVAPRASVDLPFDSSIVDELSGRGASSR